MAPAPPLRPNHCPTAEATGSADQECHLALRGIRAEREGNVVLDVPALDLYRGEVLVVVGPNGAGKSTLLRVLGRLEQPTAGQLFLRRRAACARLRRV